MVTDRHQASIQFDDRITPGQVSIRSFAVGVFDSPRDKFPTIVGLQDFPFRPVGPIFLLRQQTFRYCDLIVEAALCVLRVIHAASLVAATGK